MTDSDKTLEQALHKAADILSRRDHSEKELRDKLSKFYEWDIIESVVAQALANHWILPPQEMAESAALNWSRAGKSPSYISHQLLKRGLPSVTLDSDVELETMKTLLKKKFKSWEESKTALNYEERTKAYRFLSYRGFNDALIRKVLHEEQ